MSDPPAVVVDTNVFVAAGFNPGSDSARLLDEVRRGTVRLTWNDETRRETERIVRKIPPLSRYSIAELFRSEHRYTGATDPAAFALVADPDDRTFAALAAATRATVITMDDHLLSVRSQTELPILTPGEFVRHMRASRGD